MTLAPEARILDRALVEDVAVDADGHVNEGGQLDKFIDDRFKAGLNRAPWTLTPPAEPSPYTPMSSWNPAVIGNLGREGGHDPLARLKDMDNEGIDAAVLYPTQLLHFQPEAELFGAMCRAYNNWLKEYCDAAPDRLFGVGVVPLQHVRAAVLEMARCVEELGFRAVMVRPAAYVEDRPLYDPVYDNFWEAAQELDCPIGVHPFPFSDLPGAVRLLGLDRDSYGDPSEDLTFRQGLGNALDMMVATGWFVAGGICERFPRLKVIILEGSGGWMVTMLERFDHQYRVFGSHRQDTLPSELFARQCWVSFDPDEAALPFSVERLGADRILWASDYPHPDAMIEGVGEELREAVGGLPDDARGRVLGANAAGLYRL